MENTKSGEFIENLIFFCFCIKNLYIFAKIYITYVNSLKYDA